MGTVSTYTPRVGWDEYVTAVLGLVPNDGRREDSKVVLEECRRVGVNVCRLYHRWRYWQAARDNPWWIKDFTAGEWKSLRMFVTAELKTK